MARRARCETCSPAPTSATRSGSPTNSRGQTITLAQGQLSVDQSLTIVGLGASKLTPQRLVLAFLILVLLIAGAASFYDRSPAPEADKPEPVNVKPRDGEKIDPDRKTLAY